MQSDVPWDNPWHFFCRGTARRALTKKGLVETSSLLGYATKGESNENNELRQLQSLSGYEITE